VHLELNSFPTRRSSDLDSWTPTSTTNAPTGRYDHTAVWTGTEMIVWGGNHTSVIGMNTGGRYNPSTDSLTATSTNNAPSARYFQHRKSTRLNSSHDQNT